MGKKSRNALSARRMPVAPVWNPEGGLLTKTRMWSVWCKLRGHRNVLLAGKDQPDHDETHRLALMVCLRCGFPGEECLNCDWGPWEDFYIDRFGD